MKVTLNDQLCIFPIIQQVIGIKTIIIHIMKVIQTWKELKSLFNSEEYHKWKEIKESHRQRKKEILSHLSRQHPFLSKKELETMASKLLVEENMGLASLKLSLFLLDYQQEEDLKGKQILSANEAIKQEFAFQAKIMKRESLKNSLSHHIQSIKIGTLRTIPIAGTFYSGLIWYKASHNR